MDPLVIQIMALFISAAMLGTAIITVASRGRKQLVDMIQTQHKTTLNKIDSIDRDQESIRLQTGEAIAGIREQVNQLGYFIRDNYVRQRDFDASAASIKDAIGVIGDKMDARDEKIEARCLRIETEIRSYNHRNDDA